LSNQDSHLRSFLRAVHRRLVLLRALESAGWGILAGSLLAALLLAITFLQPLAVHLQLLYLLPLGAAIGATWSILRQPRPIDSAAVVDTQLGLSELLSTAYYVITCKQDRGPFADAVLAMAELRCAELSSSSVVLHRFGLRGWSGIGLTAALAIALGLISANPVEIQASYDYSKPLSQQSLDPDTQQSRLAGPARGATKLAAARTLAVDFPNPDENGFNPARETGRDLISEAGRSGQKTETANPDGAGGGMGRSRSANPSNPLNASASGSSKANGSDAAAGGSGIPSEAGPSAKGPSGKTIGEVPSLLPIPAWSTPAWPAARSAASSAIRSNQIPPEYHDLVREYFNR
jgi:hypothetical protein